MTAEVSGSQHPDFNGLQGCSTFLHLSVVGSHSPTQHGGPELNGNFFLEYVEAGYGKQKKFKEALGFGRAPGGHVI